MTISRNRRALVAVTELVTFGRQNLKWLYSFIERSGALLAEGLGVTSYGTVKKLVGSQATKSKFINTLKGLRDTASVRKIDVILNLHGTQNSVWFADGDVTTSQLSADIQTLNVASKLRLLYSTACYGDSHAIDFLTAGFTSVVGAVGVNANAATEYPIVLTMWGTGSKIRDAIAVGENILTRRPADIAAQAMGFSGVNSDKNIHGDNSITINSNA